MYPDFVFVQFSFSVRESPVSVQSAILTWHSQWSHSCYFHSLWGANLTGQSGSTVCKLESWRFNDKSLRPGHTYWLRALMIPPRPAVSLLLVCAFTLAERSLGQNCTLHALCLALLSWALCLVSVHASLAQHWRKVHLHSSCSPFCAWSLPG